MMYKIQCSCTYNHRQVTVRKNNGRIMQLMLIDKMCNNDYTLDYNKNACVSKMRTLNVCEAMKAFWQQEDSNTKRGDTDRCADNRKHDRHGTFDCTNIEGWPTKSTHVQWQYNILKIAQWQLTQYLERRQSKIKTGESPTFSSTKQQCRILRHTQTWGK